MLLAGMSICRGFLVRSYTSLRCYAFLVLCKFRATSCTLRPTMGQLARNSWLAKKL
jgi:hypothetical protein